MLVSVCLLVLAWNSTGFYSASPLKRHPAVTGDTPLLRTPNRSVEAVISWNPNLCQVEPDQLALNQASRPQMLISIPE